MKTLGDSGCLKYGGTCSSVAEPCVSRGDTLVPSLQDWFQTSRPSRKHGNRWVPIVALRAALQAGALLLLGSVVPAVLSAAPLPRQQIDRAIAARAGGPVAGRSTDAEFLRRVYLDLAGTIPTSAEARAFLADKDAKKREKLIDRLLAGPDYARRMEQAISVMLLERLETATVPQAEWREYLRESFAANIPWDQLVREILLADGADAKARPAMKFYIERGVDGHKMAQDVGRLFLGMNLQCAQCHDHPNVADWKQADYYGLYAYLKQSKLFTNPKTKQVSLAEGLVTGKVAFESVFVPDKKNATGPRLPGGKEVEIPQFVKGQELAEPAKDGMPAVPKFRARELLANELPSAENRRFARTSVNRFWFLMMGRGLVHPLEMDHSANPPSHPELLDALTNDFIASKFDVKRLLREIALSESYQRSGMLPARVDPKKAPPQSYRIANPKPLSPEQLTWAVPQAAGSLEQLVQAPPPSKKFVSNDYVGGRASEPPTSLADTLDLFCTVFGNPPGEAEVEFAPSMSHSLFLMNERLILGWLTPQPGNLVDRLTKRTDDGALADELYLSVLTRLPDRGEKADVVAYLKKFPGRRAGAVGELAWALLASAEFRLNH